MFKIIFKLPQTTTPFVFQMLRIVAKIDSQEVNNCYVRVLVDMVPTKIISCPWQHKDKSVSGMTVAFLVPHPTQNLSRQLAIWHGGGDVQPM